MRVTITNSEGDKVTFEDRGQLETIVPLKEILRYEWSEILKREIAVHKREVFQRQPYHDGKNFFDKWISAGFQ
jgi:acetolactate synthase small subunit